MLRKVLPVIGVFVLAAFLQAVPGVRAQDAATFSVSGIVVDDAGAPLEGAYVYGWTSDGERGETSADKAITAADGTFTLKLAAGKGQVTASHDKFRSSDYEDLDLSADASGLRLVLPRPPPRTAIVEGTVTGPDGQPIEGAQVTLNQGCCYAYDGMETKTSPPAPESDAPVSSSGGGTSGSTGVAMTRPAIWYDGDYQTTTTGADGKYRFETYAGPRQVTAYAKGYAQSTATVEAKENASVTADLKLLKVPAADAIVIVRVVDGRTGAPLHGAGVSLQNAEWSHYAYGTTGADGTTKLTTLPGWSMVNVYHYGNPMVLEDGVASDSIRSSVMPQQQYYAYVKTLRLASGEQTVEVRLDPRPEPTVVLTGYVVDPDAKAGVPNAQVSIWNQDTGDWGSATTDATGSYKLLVRPGHYTMNAWAEKHLPGAVMFTIADDEKAKRVDVEAPAGEQRYAPCVDGCPEPGPMPLYDEKAEADSAGGGSGEVAVGAPALGGAQQTRTATTGAPNDAAADGATRGTAYQGSGGGLPPYDADAAPAQDQAAGASEVPGFGIVAALAALGLLALALRRRE